MPNDPITALEERVTELWSRAGPALPVRIARLRSDDGAPHVETRGSTFDIVITERGQELQRIAGLSLAEAARWFVFQMAVGQCLAAELRERRAPEGAPPKAQGLADDGYSRWNWMAPTIALMRRISPEFGDWAARDYAQVLRRSPLSENELRNARWPVPPGEA